MRIWQVTLLQLENLSDCKQVVIISIFSITTHLRDVPLPGVTVHHGGTDGWLLEFGWGLLFENATEGRNKPFFMPQSF